MRDTWYASVKVADNILLERANAIARRPQLLGRDGNTALVQTDDLTVSFVHWVPPLTRMRNGRRLRLDNSMRLLFPLAFDVPKEPFQHNTIIHPNTGTPLVKPRSFRQPVSANMIRLKT